MFAYVDVLNNREEAIAVWVLALAVLVLWNRDTRSAFGGLLKILAHRKVALPLVASAAYTGIIVFLAYNAGIWNPSSLRETTYWYFGTALILFFNIARAGTDAGYLTNVVRQTIGFTILLEFVVNVRVFGFWTELALVSTILIVGMLSPVARTKPEFETVGRIADGCLIVIGLGLLTVGLVTIAVDTDDVALEGLFIPPLLTLAYLPFLYALRLYARYDSRRA